MAGLNFVVRRTAAIGDAIAATVVADKLIEQGYPVVFQSHPDVQCVLRAHPRLSGVTDPNGFCHVNLDGAYERDAGRRHKTFCQMFMEVANYQLANIGIDLGPPRNCKPRLVVGNNVRGAAYEKFKPFARPWVFICPRSDYYAGRQVPDHIWDAAAAHISGTVFWLGRHPAPPGIHDLSARHLDNVLSWLSVADLLVSVDTGPLHIGAALGIPILAIEQSSSPHLHLNDQNDYYEIRPSGLDCLNCQQNVCPINSFTPPCQNVDPGLIAQEANARLRMVQSEDVSAIVTIWRPDPGVLNHCLDDLVDQVAEVVVVSDLDGEVPQTARRHPKVRYVQSPQRDSGYGRKQNFGARHSNGKYLLMMNDDVFLKPGAVEQMKAQMKPGVGMVCNLLRYPDGSIYFAGKVRNVNERGWGHIDHRQFLPTFRNPTEIENACGAAIMMPRRAFYEINGWDEEFYLFGEDDDLSLRTRRAGYKIIFTPHSEGVHLEHQSINKRADIIDLVRYANRLLEKKWSGYYSWNASRVPLGNFDYEH